LGRGDAALGEGSRDTDGVWARHWYASVEASSCFAPYDATPPDVPRHLMPLVESAMPFYRELAAAKIC